MNRQEPIYRVLVVSASEKFRAFLAPLLPPERFAPPVFADTAKEARVLLAGTPYDLVFINSPLTDEFGANLAIDISLDSGIGVMLFVKNELLSDVNAKVCPYGILTVAKPTGHTATEQSLNLLCATRERLRRMEEKAQTAEEKMEEIRIVDRAKWLLIDELKMTEPDAHRYIEKTAMDRSVSKRAVAESIIKMYQ